MFRRILLIVLSLALMSACMNVQTSTRKSSEAVYDLVVYGGTSGGVIAAVQAARMGKSVVIVEPGEHLGGLTSGGLGATDIGNKGAIGGLASDFYSRICRHYQKEDAWVWQKRENYAPGKAWDQEQRWWMFEPHVAITIFNDLIREAAVPVLFHERLDLQGGVNKKHDRIESIVLESGRTIRGRMFIDATYEGDLMALAGVSYTVGREANSRYGETLNGVQTRRATHHQFNHPVDPYIVPGDPSSGLLPGVHAEGPGAEGEGDHRVQAYNFRVCLTDAAENRLPFPKPEHYDPLRYELLLRYYEAGFDQLPWHHSYMPNRKTDTNNNHGFSTDNIGRNYLYPDADYRTREAIVEDHRLYQQGLLWTLANHPRVPEAIRAQAAQWGLARDEFQGTGHWPHQLYVREARRMVSDYVMTELNCRGKRLAPDSVGLAAYGMDSHNVQRYVDSEGSARNEGDVQVGGFPPYPIAYDSIVPSSTECGNLLVPVCLSASHIAFGSIRMEPVFMVLSESAATAACLAIDRDTTVQAVDYAELRERLLAQGQVLEWKAK